MAYSAFGAASIVTLAGCCTTGAGAASESARVAVTVGVVVVDGVDVDGVGVFTTLVESAAGGTGRRDGKRICVPMMTIAISTTARTVRLSMHLESYSLRNGVVSAGSERMAARDTTRGKPTTAQRSM